MKVAIRADASTQMGTGHVARCSTLAGELRSRDAEVLFVVRTAPGDGITGLRAAGFDVHALPPEDGLEGDGSPGRVDAASDARGTLEALSGRDRPFDWLVVDHYGLDAEWERAVRGAAHRVLALDDLADRDHACDLLLDTTVDRTPGPYLGRVPAGARLLLGARFALLRPEFAWTRPRALARRGEGGAVREILVNFGGVDPGDATGRLLPVLASALPESVRVTVVLGADAPHLSSVVRIVDEMPDRIRLLTGVTDMAERMCAADLAIGAGGVTSWERACLGLPTLLVLIADNQKGVGRALEDRGAARLCGTLREILDDPARLLDPLAEVLADPEKRVRMAHRAAAVTDGRGASRVAEAMGSLPRADGGGR